jgi:CRISPR/Cas system-associated exonuclease Cas4 (RecB family)
MAREKSISSNGMYKSGAVFDVKELNKIITKGYVESGRKDGYAKKKTFSPSSVGYGNGTCPRFWYGAFNGAHFEYTKDPVSIANMNNGTKSHERIQEALELSGVVEKLERQLKIEDPPIMGYADLVIKWNDELLVGEIKTTSQESFGIRKSTMSVPGYHKIQLLLYMHGFGIDKGFFLYENKNTHRILVVPIEMNDNNKKIVQETFDWMRLVRKAWEDKQPPTRSFEEDSKECSSCPIRKACWAGEPGIIDLPVLSVPK